MLLCRFGKIHVRINVLNTYMYARPFSNQLLCSVRSETDLYLSTEFKIWGGGGFFFWWHTQIIDSFLNPPLYIPSIFFDLIVYKVLHMYSRTMLVSICTYNILHIHTLSNRTEQQNYKKPQQRWPFLPLVCVCSKYYILLRFALAMATPLSIQQVFSESSIQLTFGL